MGQYGCAPMQISAGMDYLCKFMPLQHFNAAQSPCYRCNSDHTEFPWTDCRADAQWRGLPVTHAQWFYVEGNHQFFNEGLGLSIWNHAPDVMRCLDLWACREAKKARAAQTQSPSE